MAYPEHYYLAFGGQTYDGAEEWQCGIRFAGGDLGTVLNDNEDALNDVAADVKKFVESPAAKLGVKHTLTYCKFNKIGPDGKYADESNSYTYIYSPVVVGGALITQPPQIAVVCTLLTDADHGRAARGRFYWLGSGFSGGGGASGPYVWSTSERDAFATAAWTLIQDLGNWPDIDITGLAPAVVSKVGSGTWRHVTGVRVDNVFDTQRRRARSIPKAYKTLGTTTLAVE